MSDLSDEPVFNAESDLLAEVAANGSWSSLTTFVVNGLLVTTSHEYGDELFRVQKYVGEQNVPRDMRRLRKSTAGLMRRMGQPVIVKHMYNDLDVKLGLAEKSIEMQGAYGTVRNRDPFSHGVGFHSVERSTNEWISPDGSIVNADESPGSGYQAAPKYRGYGPGFLTYIIEPDAAEDVFKLSSTGALIKIQSQSVVCGWFPEINDNDLIINVELDKQGRVVNSGERYLAKMTQPVSIRGLDRRGRREYSGDNGNRHMINQTFEMTLQPTNSVLQNVEIDR